MPTFSPARIHSDSRSTASLFLIAFSINRVVKISSSVELSNEGEHPSHDSDWVSSLLYNSHSPAFHVRLTCHG
jgi:hypothetical protein